MVDLWNSIGQHIPHERNKAATKDNIPTIATLHKAALGMQDSWKTRKLRGPKKVKAQLVAFTSGLEDYSYLAKIIPNGDKYTSLIVGTVSSIIKASSQRN